MRIRLALTTMVLAGAALVAGALPAFTADSGSVVATVNVPAPAAPCLTLDSTAVDFGTLTFSDPSAPSTPVSTASPAVRVTSCSTAPEEIFGAASDATTPSGAIWDVSGAPDLNTCAGGVNSYQPGWNHKDADGLLYNPRPDGSFIAQIGLSLDPGTASDVSFWLQMPCRGSDGAGETATITFFTLAVLA